MYKGVIISIRNTASIITLALHKSDKYIYIYILLLSDLGLHQGSVLEAKTYRDNYP